MNNQSPVNIKLDRTCPREVASRLAYPATLGLCMAFAYGLYHSGMALESVLFAGFFFSLGVMALLELALPFRDDWKPDWRDWAVNGAYFMLNGAIDNLGKITVAAVAVYLAPVAESGTPLALAGLIGGRLYSYLSDTQTPKWGCRNIYLLL